MRKRPDPSPLPEDMTADFERAVALRRERAFEEARALVVALLERAPEHPRLLTELGNIYYREGDFAVAEDLFRRALALGGDNEAAAACLCMLYARTGRRDEAAEYASRILAARPEYPLTWYTLGTVFAWQRDWRRSLEYSLIAVAMDDAFADAHYNCACAYTQLDDPREALAHLARGLTTVHLVRLAEKDGDLDLLRGHPEFEKILVRARERVDRVEPK